jgi:DNA helicase-2/ATP-dependent DNA helicase PcrA
MANVALLTDQDTYDSDRNTVTLMTIHSSKGLEFKHVYIVGMEDTLFPSPMSNGSARDLEEERRLFYVALTRAGKQVTLSYALNRYKWGNLERSNPSRFLKEVDTQFLCFPQTGGISPGKKNIPDRKFPNNKPSPIQEQPLAYASENKLSKIKRVENTLSQPFTSSNPDTLSEGDTVQHERFGNGLIISIEGQPPNTTATVDFEKEGKKKLLLRFAKLRKIE